MSVLAVDRSAWRALFAAQAGWMLDAMDFQLFIFAIVPIQKEFGLSSGTMGGLTSVALVAGAAYVMREQVAFDHALEASFQSRPNTFHCIHQIDCAQ